MILPQEIMDIDDALCRFGEINMLKSIHHLTPIDDTPYCNM